nr:hypothetical protein [Tanacetum cinerariifolium]
MELYMQNRENGRMILESVEHDPLIWPTIEENGVTRTKKCVELSATKKIQADCDLKETNIILQDSGLAVPVFKQRDDPIAAINKMMSFLSTVVTSHFPSTKNQLINSSKPRQQATIHDGWVNVQLLQRRQSSYMAGHMARQCPKPKRKSDATWFREKVLLAEAQENGKVLNKEELEFRPWYCRTQSAITHNAIYQADDLDVYDSDCDEISTAKAVLMANLSSYGSNFLSEIRTMLFDENVIAKETNVISNADPEETLMLEEKNFGKRFIPQRELSDEQALHPITDQSASSPVKIEALWELPKDFDEIETIDIELEHRMSRLIAKNEHLRQTYKQLYDSIKPSRVHAKEQTESLVNQVNQKSVKISNLNDQLQEKVFVITTLKNDLRKLKGKDIVDNATTIAPGMYKLDPIILAPKVKNNREAHEYYLKHTIEQAAILREVVEQAKSRNPSDSASYSAYIASKSKPSGNTKNDWIPRTPSSNEKNKVEVQSKKVKSSLNKWNSDSKNVYNERVKLSVKGVKALCSVYNECLFDANHAMCLIDHVNSMNVRAKSASKKNKRRKEWKPTGKVFNTVGYKWKPTGRTFILIGDVCPLTRRPKVPKSVQNSKTKVIKFLTANIMKPSTSQGFDTSVAPYFSSIIDCRHGLVRVLPRIKFKKDHLCSACAMGKSKKQSHRPKSEDTGQEKLYLLHMDLCRPMRVASVNGKNSRLIPKPPLLVLFVPPLRYEWDLVFQPVFDKFFSPPASVASLVHMAEAPAPVESTETVFEESSTSNVISTIVHSDAPISEHLNKWIKDHLLQNIIGDPSRLVTIRLQLHEQALFCYYDSFLTVVEPKTYKDALTQLCWIEAMQEELHEFERLKVWELVPRPDKARLVARGYCHEDGIDFVESFSHVARLEAVQIVLAFFAHMNMIVYQMDVKKEFLNDILHEKAPRPWYDLLSSFLLSQGLQISQSPKGIFLNQSKYALESVKKYKMESCNPVDTPMVEKSKLDEDTQRKAVDPTHYRGMVGTLMYLTSSRPDLDSSIALIAFVDADHAGCQDTRHSTSGSLEWTRRRNSTSIWKSSKKSFKSFLEFMVKTLMNFPLMKILCLSSKNLVILRKSSEALILLLIRCINLGELLSLSSTEVYRERQMVLTSFIFQEHKSFGECTIRRMWTMLNYFGKILLTRSTKEEVKERHAKKSSDTLTTGVVIRETLVKYLSKKKEKMTVEKCKGIDLLFEVALTKEAQYEEVHKKSLRDFHKTRLSGSSTVLIPI